jgi:hypothetical protein
MVMDPIAGWIEYRFGTVEPKRHFPYVEKYYS